jgi:lambda family phage minor tail protein L
MGNEKILSEAASLQPSALISFYVLDASAQGGGILRLTPYVRGTEQDVTWQGVVYSGYPVEFTGAEFKGQGTLPRPTVRFANVLGTISALCIAYNDLVGAKFIRRRTFSRFLDGQPDADPTAALPDDVFEIDRKAYEDRNYVEFELASALEVEGVMLPRRQVMSATCAWIYRSPECSFARNVAIATKDDVKLTGWKFNAPTAPNVPIATTQNYLGEWVPGTAYDALDVVWRQITPRVKRYFIAKAGAPGPNHGIEPPNTLYWTEDLCSLSLLGCRKRFGNGPKPFGGFPGTHKVQSA